jgi:hypothetical protein
MSQKKSHNTSASHSKRHFTIAAAYHTDGCSTKFKGKSGTGRFNSRDPYESAKKAFSSLCQRKKIKGRCSMYVTVRETTRDGKGKEYSYLARRHLRDPEDISPFGHKYRVKLEAISEEDLLKKTCKQSKKSSGRMKSKTSKLLTKRKFHRN